MDGMETIHILPCTPASIFLHFVILHAHLKNTASLTNVYICVSYRNANASPNVKQSESNKPYGSNARLYVCVHLVYIDI